MMNKYQEMQSEIKNLFDTIYQLAKKKDREALKNTLKSGGCIGVYYGNYNPIILLAKEGNKQAVDFLIDEFKASLNDAVLGYALGGHVNLVNEQIAAGANPNEAACGYARNGQHEQVNQYLAAGGNSLNVIRGYARSGYIEQVNQLLTRGGSKDFALWGYARSGYIEQANKLHAEGVHGDFAIDAYALGGYVEQVNQLLARGMNRNFAVEGYATSGAIEQVNKLIDLGASRDYAIYGYAFGGHVEQVNEQIEAGGSRNRAVFAYARGGHIDQVNEQIKAGAKRELAVEGFENSGYLVHQEGILRLSAYIEDKFVREHLIETAKQNINSLDTKSLFEKATRLNRIMNDYQLTFKQAKALTVKGARTWLLQGQALVRIGVFPKDIFFEIGSSLMGVSNEDVNKIFSAVNEKLFHDLAKNHLNQFSRFFSPIQYRKEEAKLEERYEHRISFS